MSLRSKILIVFCLVALVPALITASLDTRRLKQLSAELTEKNAGELAAQAITTMERIAVDYAGLLDRETRRVHTVLELQAEYAERLLATPSQSSLPIYFPEDFVAGHQALELSAGSEPGTVAYRNDDEILPVSWTEQVFHHPTKVERATVEAGAHALVTMPELYGKVRDDSDAFIRWHYVVLENGLSATYPGHGNYPAGFDPREQAWYQEQKHLPRFRWYRPHPDTATGTIVISGTMPLFDPSGKFLGITGIDIDLSATFSALELPESLRDGSELIQLVALKPPQVTEPQLLVLARQHAEQRRADWQTLPELERFTLADQTTSDHLRDAMVAGENGNLRASINGREHFVLYQHFGRGPTYLLMIVPVETATRAAIETDTYARRATANHITTLFKFLIVASSIVVIIALYSTKHLTRPIEQLTAAVRQLSAGDFSVRTTPSTNDELKLLGDAFNAMVPQLESHAKVRKSLSLAREIQQQLLPSSAPSISGYDIAGESVYSEQTGGDYFDFLALDSNQGSRCGVVVADVAGHGVASSLLMATTRALLHGGRGRGLSLGEMLSYVNRQLVNDVSSGHFVTLFLLALDPKHGKLEWANAGHEAAAHYVAASREVQQLEGGDIPLGIDSEWAFSANSGAELEPDDIVVLVTDGVWEAVAKNGQRFGKQRLHAFIEAHAELPASELCRKLKETLESFRDGRPQHDDVTIVVIKRLAEDSTHAHA